jgi:hypothetical protein
MIRNATIEDCEPIARMLWSIWHRLKAQQIAAPSPNYTSSDDLSNEIRSNLGRWLVCESADSTLSGFFAVSSLGGDQAYRRWRFPESAIRIESFACLLAGEVLFQQFELLARRLRDHSILVCIPTQLREAYWAALKAGFRLLGESPLIVGAVVWLYLDRDQRHDEIQKKLRRSRIIT